MESAELDDVSDSTNEVPKLSASDVMPRAATPHRMPAGTIVPQDPNDLTDLDALRSQARHLRSTHAWSELAQTLRSIIDLGQLTDAIDEQETIDLYTQLGELEGDVLGHVADAIDAWREVVALDASDVRALEALEQLFARDGRWHESIEVIEKRALLLDDDHQRCDAWLQAAATCEDRLGDVTRASEIYERVRRVDPGNATAAERLEAIYRQDDKWAEVVELLLERSESVVDLDQQVEILHEVATIYERELDDREGAFYVLQAAFARDHAHARTLRELERLAAATQLWQELVDDVSKRAGELEPEQPGAAADLWVTIGRWYSEQLAHVEYAIHAAQQALRIEPHHVGALAAIADLQRKRGVQHAVSMEQARDVAGSIAAYRQVLAHEPASGTALDALDRLYRQTQAWAPLVEILARRAELATDDADRVRWLLEVGSIHDQQLVDPAPAIAAYAQVLELEPANAVALRALDALYEPTTQHDKFLAVLEAQLAAATSDAERITLYERLAAAWEERLGKLDRAADAYKQILAIDARSYATYHLLERLYQQAGMHAELVETYRDHILATNDVATRVELSVAIGKISETNLRDNRSAIDAYDSALSLDRDHAHALGALGRLYEQAGEWERALAVLGRLVQLDGDTRKQDLYSRIGRIHYRELGDGKAAEASWLRGLDCDADHLATMQALSELYTDRGDWLEAAQMMVRAESVTRVTTDKTRLLFDAANLHLHKLRAIDDAKRLYASVIALDPEHVEAGRVLAGMYFEASEWTELAPVIDMLCRKAGQLRVEPNERRDLHYRAARCADEQGALPKALGYYDAAYAIDATHVPTLIGRADLLFKMQDWQNAVRCYQIIAVQHRDSGDPTVLVRSYNRMGKIRQTIGERKQALGLFGKALELDPQHRDTLEAIIALQTEQSDWEAVAHAKRGLMAIADDREKTKLANEIAAIYRDRLSNAPKATVAYLEALALAPEDRQLLQKVLDLYIDTKQWKKAVEIIERFVALEPDSFRKGVYFHAAATLCRDELRSLDEAVDYFDCALDSFFSQPERLDESQLPRALMSFEAIDAVLTTTRDWKAQERAYRDMIKRLPQDGNPRFVKLHVGLIDALGEIYRSRLKQYDDASGAFEIAQQLDPDNKLRHGTDRAEILAELYVLAGPDRADKAIAQHTRMLGRAPFKYDSYKALARIYRDTSQYDKYWCLCNTLAFLKKADADELQFAEQYKATGLPKAKSVMSQATWDTLAHADENRGISAIFGAAGQSVAAMKAFPLKELGIKREERRQLQGDSLMFSKLFVYAAQVLGVQLPDVYVRDDNKAADIQLANAIDKSELLPSFMVPSQLLQGKTEREVAFLLARKLTYMRPEYYLRMLLQTNTELKVAVLSAIVMVQPQFPVPPNMVAAVQQYLPEMKKRLSSHALEQLGAIVHRFVQATPDLNLAKWGHAVDAVSHRAGFILCGELATAARAIAVDPVVLDGPTVKDKLKELVLFSISESYFIARAQLGIAISG